MTEWPPEGCTKPMAQKRHKILQIALCHCLVSLKYSLVCVCVLICFELQYWVELCKPLPNWPDKHLNHANLFDISFMFNRNPPETHVQHRHCCAHVSGCFQEPGCSSSRVDILEQLKQGSSSKRTRHDAASASVAAGFFIQPMLGMPLVGGLDWWVVVGLLSHAPSTQNRGANPTPPIQPPSK